MACLRALFPGLSAASGAPAIQGDLERPSEARRLLKSTQRIFQMQLGVVMGLTQSRIRLLLGVFAQSTLLLLICQRCKLQLQPLKLSWRDHRAPVGCWSPLKACPKSNLEWSAFHPVGSLSFCLASWVKCHLLGSGLVSWSGCWPLMGSGWTIWWPGGC